MQPLFTLPFMKKPAGSKEAAQPSDTSPAHSDDETRLKLYRLIIERYRDKIEEYETKSVSELKSLVQPHDPKILQIKESLLEQFHPYVHETHFLEASALCFAYVSSFRTLSAPVSFWLSFSDMQELFAGDEIDKSILLCSLLRCLGSENSKVFVTDTKNSYVLFQYSGKSFVADHSLKEIQQKETGALALSSLKGRILYAFNDKDYEDFSESE